VRSLTELFGAARDGPEEPAEEDALVAERSAPTAVADLRAARRG
jgi:hypothetical protein